MDWEAGAEYVVSTFPPASFFFLALVGFLDELTRKGLLRGILLSVSKELQASVAQMLDSAFHHTVIYYS